MKARLTGLGVIALGVACAWLFVYLPLERIDTAPLSIGRIKGLVAVPLLLVIGVALLVGGPAVQEALVTRRRSRGQLALVLALLGVAAAGTAAAYWRIAANRDAAARPEIIRPDPGRVPQVRQPDLGP